MSAKLAYQINGQTIYNVYDASGSLIHIDKASAGQVTDYVSGPAGTLARITNDVVTYLHPDWCIFWFPKIAQGSAQAGTTISGFIAWREQYTPFGEQLQSPADNDNLDGFTGHIKDKDTGLNPCIFPRENCTVQARYYDPVIGRFLSIDPVTFLDTGNPGMFNRYAYTFNDPINMLDSDGRKPEHVQDRVSQGIRAARQNPEAGARVALGAVAVSVTAVAVTVTAVAAGPATASLAASAGASPTVAGIAGSAVTSGLVAAELQTATDYVNTGSVDLGNTAKAGGLGLGGGLLTGSVPVVAGATLATNVAKAELGVSVGLLSAAVMNGADTNGQDLAAGAILGGIGGVKDSAGAAATVTREVIKENENDR